MLDAQAGRWDAGLYRLNWNANDLSELEINNAKSTVGSAVCDIPLKRIVVTNPIVLKSIKQLSDFRFCQMFDPRTAVRGYNLQLVCVGFEQPSTATMKPIEPQIRIGP